LRIYCLTLTQPWASLVAAGEKRVETRSAGFWRVQGPRLRPGDLLAIHAAKGFPKRCRELCDFESFNTALMDRAGAVVGIDAYLPTGKVLSVHRLGWARNAEQLALQHFSQSERAFGDYSPGRVGFYLQHVLELEEPLAAKGSQGFWWWEVPEAVEAALREKGAI
jgi:hypothetical protein